MALFGKKNKSLPKNFEPEMPPSLSAADLADASRLMDQWDASMGNSNATWSCIEAIARRGGFKGSQASLMEVMDGKEASDVTQRPWRWWNEVARLAHANGNDVLAGRIFLFTHLFVTQVVKNMRAVDMMETGLEPPNAGTYEVIAGIAVRSLARLSPEFVIHNTATGKVDVASALNMAEQVSGIAAPRSDAPLAQTPIEPINGDSGQFNTL
jgi:hypothetical protein